ncbi:MAG TPA: hypothetical protein VE465_07215 [Streptosporangiaceae bacterium]|nr:hypothetical protein [Streptosporangiaceae bacterium]
MAMLTSAVRPADPRDYITYLNQDPCHQDWKSFHEWAPSSRELGRAPFKRIVAAAAFAGTGAPSYAAAHAMVFAKGGRSA